MYEPAVLFKQSSILLKIYKNVATMCCDATSLDRYTIFVAKVVKKNKLWKYFFKFLCFVNSVGSVAGVCSVCLAKQRTPEMSVC